MGKRPSWRSSVVVWRENTRTHLYPPQTNPLSILENICPNHRVIIFYPLLADHYSPIGDHVPEQFCLCFVTFLKGRVPLFLFIYKKIVETGRSSILKMVENCKEGIGENIIVCVFHHVNWSQNGNIWPLNVECGH